jgi:hypothetical protein
MKRRLLALFIAVITIVAVFPSGVLAQPTWLTAQNSNPNFFPSTLPSPEVLWIQNMDGDVTDLAVGDLNSDGEEDVVAIDQRTLGTLDVLYGDGDGAGNAGLMWHKDYSGYAVAVGDIDGDHINEVVAQDADNYTLFAYENTGEEKWHCETVGLVKDIQIGDIDGDGKNDVVACDDYSSPGTIYAIDGVTGEDIPGWPVTYENEDFVSVALGQLDGVGGLDVAAISENNNFTLMVFASTGVESIWSKPISGRAVEIGDVNGDGENEVVAGAENLVESIGGSVLVYRGYDGFPLYNFETTRSVTDIQLGELDDNVTDGLEVACIDSGGPATLYVLDIDNETDQIIWRYNMSWDSEYYGECLAIGDVDKDYKNEVVACSSIAVHEVFAFDGLDNNGDGIGDLVWTPYEISGVNYPRFTDLEIGDLNGDGVQEVVVGTTAYTQDGSQVIALVGPESKTESATGRGEVYFDADPSSIEQENLAPIDEADLPPFGKPDFRYPFGFFSFTITNLPTDYPQTVTVTVTLPYNAPVGTKWVKCQDGVWSTLDIGDDDGDNVITYQLTDGGIGDGDYTFNGEILEPGGPGLPIRQGVGGEVVGINKMTLIPWMALTVALMIGGTVLVLSRRRRS